MMEIIDKIKDNIVLLNAFAVWLLSIIGSYLTSPDIYSDYLNANTIKGLIILFISAITVTISFILNGISVEKSKRKILYIGWTSLILGTIIFFIYLDNLGRLTTIYPKNSGIVVVIGNQYKNEVIKDAKSVGIIASHENVDEIINIVAPDSYKEFKEIWPSSELKNNGYLLIGLYISVVLFLVIFLQLNGYLLIHKP